MIGEDELRRAFPHAPHAARIAVCPTRVAALMPFLLDARATMDVGDVLILCDIVWQTAPTPELLRAFAPAQARDKVRPIEGYEMQIEHAGFEIDERLAIDRARWVPGLAPDTRAAVEADARGAAKLAAWRARAT